MNSQGTQIGTISAETTQQNNEIETNSLSNYGLYDNEENNEQNNLYNNGNEDNNSTSGIGSSISDNFDLMFLKDFFLLCPECNENFLFKLINFEYMNIECGCKFIKYCTTIQFLKNFKAKPVRICCITHKAGNINKSFIKYCKDCKINLCEDCLKEEAIFNNSEGYIKIHETHEIIDLLDNKKDIEETKKLISDNENINRFNKKHLIINLVNNYEKCPSYYAYKTIKMLNKFITTEKSNKILPELLEKKEFEELIIIHSIKNLKEKIEKNKSKLIYKIVIDGNKENDTMGDLNIFENKNFDKLKKLQLNNIKSLKDIKALRTCSFPELTKLIIGCTELNDECINVIKNLNLPKIKFISFFSNKITSPEIFGTVEKFNTLEKFFIGSNKIDINKLPNEKIRYNFPKNLEELGISNMFNKKTNNFIPNHLNLENLKILYVNGNGITSLKLYENIKFKRLEEFWLRGDINIGCLESIEDLKYLQDKKSIKKIVVKQNRIKDIEKLLDIISLFPSLELFNIEDNEIEKEKIETVVAKIKEKGFENLTIKYN